jgi:hypothetical protein
MTSRVSLTELAAAGIRLRPAEAVTLVAEVCRQHAAGKLRGIPSPSVVRLTRDGAVVAEGPVPTTRDAVKSAAQLLNVLVGGFDAPPEYRASGGLQIVLARALGTLDLPPYDSLDEFCGALGRFAAFDVAETAGDLFRDWVRTRMPSEATAAPLTISDVRRARRATGLTLQDIAAVAGVPAARLRDLEWGDVRKWRADAEGRAHVVRYARAAGLDDKLVLSIAWPMIEEAFARADQEGALVTALVPAGPQQIAPATSVAPRGRGTRGMSRQRWETAAALVLAVSAMCAMAWMPTTATRRAGPVLDDVPALVSAPRFMTASTPAGAPSPSRLPTRARPQPAPGAGPIVQEPVSARVAVAVPNKHVAVSPRKTAASKQPGRATAPRDAAKPRTRTSFLEKPLLRIVFK